MSVNGLKTVIGSLTLDNPLILASGIIGSTYSALNRAFNEGFGAVVTKSTGLTPRDGYPNPSVIYLPEIDSVINAVGLANPGYIEFAEELLNIKQGVKYVISLFGSSADEFTLMTDYYCKKLADNPPVAFELNLSCPHASKVGMAVGTDAETVYSIVKAVTANQSKASVWVKLTPNITDIIPIAQVAVEAGANALVAINTVKALIIDIFSKKPILSNIRGGLSGKAIKPIGVRTIYDLYEEFGNDIQLIGVGGVFTWKDVIEYILAGANAVQIGSALANSSSPHHLITKIKRKINEYLTENNITINELRGLAHE